MRVQELMDPEPPTASVPGSRAELLRLFHRVTLPGVPILKQGSRKLAGLVMRADLVRSPGEAQTALLMNPNPITLYPQASAREAASLIARSRCPVLPVVNGSNDLVGLLTARHLLEALLDNRGRVQTYLQRRVVPVHLATPVFVAAQILHITGASALPVLDAQARLVGILTDGDLLGAATEQLVSERTQQGQARDEDEWNREAQGRPQTREHLRSHLTLSDVPVERIMVKHARSLPPLAHVGEAGRLMYENDWSQIPIVDAEGRLLDLLTDVDLMSAIL